MEIVFLILLIVLMAGALGIGFPVAFALPGAAIVAVALAGITGWILTGDEAAFFAQSGPIDWLTAGVTNFRGLYWEPERDTLIAIPLFVFMGIALQRSKIAEDLLMTMAKLFGPIPGGLGISVVFVGMLLAATTGVLGATVVAMGLISLPAMIKNRYSPALASGTIAASGALGQIIPPSIVLIILADQLSSAVDQAQTQRADLYKIATGETSLPSEFAVTSTSAGDMFMGAIIPGLILVALYMVFIAVLALLKPSMAPAVRMEEKLDLRMAARIFVNLVPPLVLIFAVLGSIIFGIATVTQAGSVGAAGAMIMASYRLAAGQRNAFYPAILAVASLIALAVILSLFHVNVKAINTSEDELGVVLAAIATGCFLVALGWSMWRMLAFERTLQGVMMDTAKATALVFIILMGAAMLTAAFRAFGGEELVRDFLTGLPGGFWTQFLIVMLVIFILGFFIDFIEITVVVVPIVAPILLMDPAANITAVWFGVMIGLNIQTSFLTPPFGFALFYLRGVAPAAVRTIDIYRGVVPFIALQLLAMAIVAYLPPLVNYMPMRLSLTAETAPPPVNPRLQHCIEDYMVEQYAERGEQIAAAIEGAAALPAELLPAKLAKQLDQGLDRARSIPGLLAEIRAADEVVERTAVDYRPLHEQVRGLERNIGQIDKRIAYLETQTRRLESDEEERRADFAAKIAELQAEKQALLAAIPAEWETRHKDFLVLVNAAEDARKRYRRELDQAYTQMNEIQVLLRGTPDFVAVGAAFDKLDGLVAAQDGAGAEELAGEIAKQLDRAKIADDDITGELSKLRREAKKGSPDWAKVEASFQAAFDAYQAELGWREAAARDLLAGLDGYELAIRDTIGLRQQLKLPEDVAVQVAGCMSHHRDVSLSF